MMTTEKIESATFASTRLLASRQTGFTLIEALVAFLILSIGMLGVASLQLISVRAGITAAFRSVAVIKVEDMFERIRNNPSQVLAYDDDTTDAFDNVCNDYDGTVQSCDSLLLVAYDKYEWEQELAVSLPGIIITTSIGVTNADPGTQPLSTVTITVNWDERIPGTQATVAAQATETMTYSTSADICGSMAC